ncbi:hypothetical protein BJ742DRAFT_907870 [Cladochytrium replicatum]|nr:hypothetical protein BJ742DRAFT_907870 [Cladochytrium replicatum]
MPGSTTNYDDTPVPPRSFTSQLSPLLRKNITVQFRTLRPIIYLALSGFFLYRVWDSFYRVTSINLPKQTYTTTFPPLPYLQLPILESGAPENVSLWIHYAPRNTNTTETVDLVLDILKSRLNSTGATLLPRGFDNPSAMSDFTIPPGDPNNLLWASVTFTNPYSYTLSITTNVHGIFTSKTLPTFPPRNTSSLPVLLKLACDETDWTCRSDSFLRSGLFALQQAFDIAMSRNAAAVESVKVAGRVNVTFFAGERVDPVSGSEAEASLVAFSNVGILSLILPFLLIQSGMVVDIVTEKEKKLKESILLSGISSKALMLSWLIPYAINHIAPIIGFSIMISVCSHSNFLLVFLSFIVFSIANLAASYVLATPYNNSKLAGTLPGLIFLPVLLLSLIIGFIPQYPALIIVLSILIYPIGLMYLVVLNVFTFSAFSGWPAAYFGAMVLSCCWVVGLAFYLDRSRRDLDVNGRRLGVRWKGGRVEVGKEEEADGGMEEENVIRDEEPIGRRKLVDLVGLRKVFYVNNVEKVAVADLTLSLYEGEIFALLGHNGAGKTTALQLITGILSTTSGTGTVAGHPISNRESVRKQIGFVWQENVFWDDLTIGESVRFMAEVKGIPRDQAADEAHRVLSRVDLLPYQHRLGRILSGGQKRKLMIAIALLGSPKILFLDEPTSSLDPASRRDIWKLLLSLKNNDRTLILLTTHFMDEADVVADRKGIMVEGVLRCVGTSSFLKRRFGVGARLDVNVDARDTAETRAAIEEALARVHGCVLGSMPGARLDTTSGTARMDIGGNFVLEDARGTMCDMKWLLPVQEGPDLATLFEDLERLIQNEGWNEAKRGQSSSTVRVTVSLSSPTMEDVFIKTRHLKINNISESSTQETLTEQVVDVQEEPLVPPSIKPTFFNEVIYLADVNLKNLTRRPFYLFTILLPTVVLVIVSSLFLKIGNSTVNADPYAVEPAIPQTILYGVVNKAPDGTSGFASTISTMESALDRAVTNFEKSSLIKLKRISTTATEPNNADIFTWPETTLGAVVFLPGSSAANTTWRTKLFVNATFLYGGGVVNNVANSLLVSALSGSSYEPTMVLQGTMIPGGRFTAEVITRLVFQVVQGFIFLTGITTMVASLAVETVYDSENGRRDLLLTTGVSIPGYYLSHFFSEFLVSLPIVLVCGVLYVTLSGFTDTVFSVAIIFAAIFAIVAMFPALYFFASLTTKVPIFQFYVAILTLILAVAVSVAGTLDVQIWFMIFVPIYPLGGFFQLLPSRGWDAFTIAVPIMAGHLVIFSILLWLVERRRLSWRGPPPTKTMAQSTSEVDYFPEDVMREEDRIRDMYENPSDDIQGVYGYRLYRRFGNKLAVQNVSLGIERGTVLSVLGPNGSGKSTTVNLVVGNMFYNAGHVFFSNVEGGARGWRRQMGLCPQQEDPAWKQMTVRENLRTLALVKGVQRKDVDEWVSKLIDAVGLSGEKAKVVETLSGGNKRKLAFALSIVADPIFLFVDEPSTGVDPVSRRNLWRVLIQGKSRRATLLTTHVMEEAESVSTRVLIMAHSMSRCIGTTQELKSRMLDSYILTLIIDTSHQNIERWEPNSSTSPRSPLSAFVISKFPRAKYRFSFMNVQTWHIPISDLMSGGQVGLSEILKALEDAKERAIGGLRGYSLGQMSLEDVFLMIAEQAEEAGQVD